MHCKIRHFAQAEIQYSTDLFNRIGRKQTSVLLHANAPTQPSLTINSGRT